MPFPEPETALASTIGGADKDTRTNSNSATTSTPYRSYRSASWERDERHSPVDQVG
jgi:hypothetical protein